MPKNDLIPEQFITYKIPFNMGVKNGEVSEVFRIPHVQPKEGRFAYLVDILYGIWVNPANWVNGSYWRFSLSYNDNGQTQYPHDEGMLWGDAKWYSESTSSFYDPTRWYFVQFNEKIFVPGQNIYCYFKNNVSGSTVYVYMGIRYLIAEMGKMEAKYHSLF